MIRPLRLLIVFVVLAGCQQPGPATDPFLYRSTIPPPGTCLSSAPAAMPGPQPYYSTPPASAPCASSDSLSTPPPIVQPAPIAPAPVVPVLPPRNYPTRGGFDVPQSYYDRHRAAGDEPPIEIAATESDPAEIRIIEPPVEHSAALPADSFANPAETSGTPTNSSPSWAPDNLRASAVVPTSAEFPVSADPPAATGTRVNYPSDHPGLTYGYDPGYSALRGKLDYSVAARLWRLQYLPQTGPTDAYGGNVVIADSHQVSGFEPGDFVTVHGVLSAPTAPSTSATYAIARIKRQ